MQGSSARKATGMVLTAIAIVALAAGSAFAGTDHSSGDNRLNNTGTNNKNGTVNKGDNLWCGTDFTRVDADWSSGYDVNKDGWICQKLTESGYDYTDNTVRG